MGMIQSIDKSGNQTKPPLDTPKEDDKDGNPAAGNNGDSNKPPAQDSAGSTSTSNFDFSQPIDQQMSEMLGFPPEGSK